MGYEIAPRPPRCASNAKTSERQQAGHRKRGGGGPPPRLFASGLSLEKAWIPARDRAGTRVAGLDLQRSQRDHLPTSAEAPSSTWGPHPSSAAMASERASQLSISWSYSAVYSASSSKSVWSFW